MGKNQTENGDYKTNANPTVCVRIASAKSITATTALEGMLNFPSLHIIIKREATLHSNLMELTKVE